jgi:hypothetical protein
MIKKSKHKDHYVYVLEYQGKCLYIGSGRGSRINHLLSGVSHNVFLNEFSFYCDKDKAVIYKIAENLSKEDSLKIELEEIKNRGPYFNINDVWERLDPEATARAVVLDTREKFICKHYEETYLID